MYPQGHKYPLGALEQGEEGVPPLPILIKKGLVPLICYP